jgi:putative oxidoreductase
VNKLETLLSPKSIAMPRAIGFVRMGVGALLAYHGQEVFNPELMEEYATWDTFHESTALFMVYLGKGSEFVAGVLLLLGLLTRVGAFITICTFGYITFFVGHGKFWYQDQHPFMFALFGLLFFFTGPGAWSLDALFFEKDQNK